MMKNFTHQEPITPLQEMSTVYVDGTRMYTTPAGSLPSVTTVVGWEKSNFFAKWRAENPKESKRVLKRGNELHSLIESYIKNEDINLHSVTPNIKDLFFQLKPELDKLDNIVVLEGVLWSERIGLAGRVDCIAEYDGTLNIIDFKGSTRKKKRSHIGNYLLQATAYALMWQDMTDNEITDFKIMVGCEDCCICQIFEGKVLDYVKPLHEIIEKYKHFSKKDEEKTLPLG